MLAVAAAGDPDRISGELILALWSKETDLRNIESFGRLPSGAPIDTGIGQFNRRAHERWLRSIPGAAPGSFDEKWTPAQDGAYPAGRVPAGVKRQALKSRSILRYNMTYALGQGVPEADVVSVAVAGYNVGIGTAVQDYLKHGDENRRTTGGDYSEVVLGRRAMIRRALRELGWGI